MPGFGSTAEQPQAFRTRQRENGRVDADTWFQTTLPSRKSPNLSNTESVCGGP
jgi:hypothetical protein